MRHEYHLTYSMLLCDPVPTPATQTVIRPSLEHIMDSYHKLIELKKKRPMIEINDIKLTRREYSEDDITPS